MADLRAICQAVNADSSFVDTCADGGSGERVYNALLGNGVCSTSDGTDGLDSACAVVQFKDVINGKTQVIGTGDTATSVAAAGRALKAAIPGSGASVQRPAAVIPVPESPEPPAPLVDGSVSRETAPASSGNGYIGLEVYFPSTTHKSNVEDQPTSGQIYVPGKGYVATEDGGRKTVPPSEYVVGIHGGYRHYWDDFFAYGQGELRIGYGTSNETAGSDTAKPDAGTVSLVPQLGVGYRFVKDKDVSFSVAAAFGYDIPLYRGWDIGPWTDDSYSGDMDEVDTIPLYRLEPSLAAQLTIGEHFEVMLTWAPSFYDGVQVKDEEGDQYEVSAKQLEDGSPLARFKLGLRILF